jgi:hypothetical protein
MKVGFTQWGSTNSPQSLSRSLGVVFGSGQSIPYFSHISNKTFLVSSDSKSSGSFIPRAFSIPSISDILLKGGLKLISTTGLGFFSSVTICLSVVLSTSFSSFFPFFC